MTVFEFLSGATGTRVIASRQSVLDDPCARRVPLGVLGSGGCLAGIRQPLFDDVHLGLELLLIHIRCNLISLRIAAAVDIGLQTGITLCDVQLVEGGLQVVDLFLLRYLLAMGDNFTRRSTSALVL